MEPLQIHGGRVANSDDLRLIARDAIELEYKNQLDPALLDQLDPNGNHILFPRPDDLDPGIPVMVEEVEGPYPKVAHVALALLDAIPCEAYLKLRGKGPGEPTKAMLDVSVKNLKQLHTIEEAKRQQGIFHATDGQHRRHS